LDKFKPLGGINLGAHNAKVVVNPADRAHTNLVEQREILRRRIGIPRGADRHKVELLGVGNDLSRNAGEEKCEQGSGVFAHVIIPSSKERQIHLIALSDMTTRKSEL
jgi:hypothetical protein